MSGRDLTESSVARSIREFRNLAQTNGIVIRVDTMSIRLCPHEFTGWSRRQARAYLRRTIRLASAEA